MPWTNPHYLVETDWLAANLDDPSLRVLECTTILHPLPDGGYKAESGRAAWGAGHIPRSGFADLTDDLCDRAAATLYMMPSTEQMAASMARLGVGEGTRVVLYDRAVNMWAARVWWMLRAVGFDRAAVLNGGWKKWTLEGRPTSTEPCAYPSARFVARPRPGRGRHLRPQRALAGAAPRHRRRRVRAARAHRRHRQCPGARARRSDDPRLPRARRAAPALRRRGSARRRASDHLLRRRHRGQQRRVRARPAGPRSRVGLRRVALGVGRRSVAADGDGLSSGAADNLADRGDRVLDRLVV